MRATRCACASRPTRSATFSLIECRLDGEMRLRLYVLLAPHLGATGYGNIAAGRTLPRPPRAVGRTRPVRRGTRRRRREPGATPSGATSAGYVGTSDGWQDFARHGAMTWQYATAGPGQCRADGELPRAAVLGLGLWQQRRSGSDLGGFEPDAAVRQSRCNSRSPTGRRGRPNCASAGRYRSMDRRHLGPVRTSSGLDGRAARHLDKTYPGAMVASLSVPWGDSGNERGGYHLVWPRDLVECAGAFLALGADNEARDTLRYLIATQNDDGHWHQNQWLGGTPYWQGIQLDETAFPVLLAAALDEREAVARDRGRGHGTSRARLYRAHRSGDARRTAGRRVKASIRSPSPYRSRRWWPARSSCRRPHATGHWRSRISGTPDRGLDDGRPIPRSLGGSAYPVIMCGSRRSRCSPTAARSATVVPIRNRSDDSAFPADEQIGTEFLQLVRFGLRAPTIP